MFVVFGENDVRLTNGNAFVQSLKVMILRRFLEATALNIDALKQLKVNIKHWIFSKKFRSQDRREYLARFLYPFYRQSFILNLA